MTVAREAVDGLPVLALNAGSSSLKFGLYRAHEKSADIAFSGEIEYAGDGSGTLSVDDAKGRRLKTDPVSDREPRHAVECIRRLLAELAAPAPCAIGHRIVHGGMQVRRHCLIDPQVMHQLEAASAFAPLHVPPALALVHAMQLAYPSTPQIACLDTAFHADLPEAARTLPLPRELREQGIQRYGFHGLSCESIVRQLDAGLPPRLVIAHLGSGASVTAVASGKSIDTSMGMTPSGGLIMATRCGDLDPGVLAYLMRERNYDSAGIEELIDHRSGLLGISGLGNDMRELHVASATHPDAKLAIDMFCDSVRKHIAAMAAALGGIDMLVFTGGIGEHDAVVREAVCEGLSWMGLTSPGIPAGCRVRVLRTHEEQQIAIHAAALSREAGVGR